jgi:hypothetical protein
VARNYYYLVASLREYALDAEQKGFDAVAVRQEIAAELSPADQGCLRDFYTFYDIANLIELHKGHGRLNALGCLSPEELEDRLKAELKEPDELSEGFEHRLWRQFYERCEQSPNGFIRAWYTFDRQLRNICTAWTLRKAGRDIAPELVAGDDIADALAHNSSIDFGLKNEVDYIEPLVAILENPNILEKERALDRLRWAQADRLAEFDTFSLNRILSVCAKTCIIHRWTGLDETVGNEMFLQLVGELTVKPVNM